MFTARFYLFYLGYALGLVFSLGTILVWLNAT